MISDERTHRGERPQRLPHEGTTSGEARPHREVPYLHVVGVGGEGEPLAKIRTNRAGLLRLHEQVDAALRAEEGMASSGLYRQTDERRFELFVQRAYGCPQVGEVREPEPPYYSMFA